MSSSRKMVAIVTGASKGIGKGIAIELANEGYDLVLTAREPNSLEQAVEEIRKINSSITVIGETADVAKAEDMKKVAKIANEKFGAIDVLCQNAGIFPVKNLDEMTGADWNNVIATNLTGTFNAVQSVIPTMKQQKYGRVILISSITGPRTGIPGLSHYSASKGGVNGFMKTAALELAPYNITVNAVEPGNILTEGLEGAGSDYINTMLEAIPVGRLGSPKDIGHVVAFLASPKSSFITGQSIISDGGQTLPESRLANKNFTSPAPTFFNVTTSSNGQTQAASIVTSTPQVRSKL